MRVLITNDDGISAPGIVALAAALREHHEVIVVAPDRDMSGSSASISRFGGVQDIVFERYAMPGLDGTPAYAIAAGPGLAVLSACLGAFGAPPELVVSGINSGANLGHSILHSGTVGAVLTAQSFGARGLAVSSALGGKWRWDTASLYAVRLAAWMEALPSRTAINLNVPALDAREVRGLRLAALDRFGTIRIALGDESGNGSAIDGRAIDGSAIDGSAIDGSAIDGGASDGNPPGRGRLQLELCDGAVDPEPESDAALLAAGFATYTPIVGVSEADLGREPPTGATGTLRRRVVSGGSH
jgi:5'-nucleotidase